MVITIYSDPGHGWAKVKFSLLEKLGIADQVSSYSYLYGEHVYLEEDCDLSLFIKAMRANDLPVTFKESNTNSRSTIREYTSYSLEKARNMPKKKIGERVKLGSMAYTITRDLGRRGAEVIAGHGAVYRMRDNQLFSGAQLVREV